MISSGVGGRHDETASEQDLGTVRQGRASSGTMASDVPMAIRHTGVVQARSAAPAGYYDFYSLHFAPMVRLARGLVDTSECAEEIVQDAFLRVFQHWDRLYEPLGYLRTAVINAARSELRKREVRRRAGRQLPSARVPTEGDYLIDALDKLASKRRTALVLRYYAQMSEREIAEAMGVAPGTVKSLVSRGLADLRRVIKP